MDEYNVVISEDAMSALDSHAEFLARVSKSAALELIDNILEDIETLKKLPERCPAYNNPFVPRGRYRKLLSSKRYLIVFEIGSGAVYVDYILDARQDTEHSFNLYPIANEEDKETVEAVESNDRENFETAAVDSAIAEAEAELAAGGKLYDAKEALVSLRRKHFG